MQQYRFVSTLLCSCFDETARIIRGYGWVESTCKGTQFGWLSNNVGHPFLEPKLICAFRELIAQRSLTINSKGRYGRDPEQAGKTC